MKIIKIKRLWNNLASLRDYVVMDAIKKNQTIQVELNGKTMTLTPDKLAKQSFQAVGDKFESKFSAKKYTLIDFAWKADE